MPKTKITGIADSWIYMKINYRLVSTMAGMREMHLSSIFSWGMTFFFPSPFAWHILVRYKCSIHTYIHTYIPSTLSKFWAAAPTNFCLRREGVFRSLPDFKITSKFHVASLFLTALFLLFATLDTFLHLPPPSSFFGCEFLFHPPKSWTVADAPAILYIDQIKII